MLRELSSLEVAEWSAFFQYREAQEKTRQSPPSRMPQQRATPPREEPVYDQLIPDNVFE